MIRVMIASGIEPSAIAGRMRCLSASTKASALPVRSESIRTKFVVSSRCEPGIDPTRRRQDLELDREDVLEGEAEDEDRDRDPEQRDDGDDAVLPALDVARGPAARAGCPRPTAKISAPTVSSIVAGKRERELLGDRPVVDDALAEVALDELAEVEQVLLVERPVEPELVEDLAAQLRRGVLPEERGDRVTRAAGGRTRTG